jgi:hypothetical protein
MEEINHRLGGLLQKEAIKRRKREITMQILFWRVERSTKSSLTAVRINVQRNPEGYIYQWKVADKKRRLSKRELHELDMRVAKYVATRNDNPPVRPEHKTYFAHL